VRCRNPAAPGFTTNAPLMAGVKTDFCIFFFASRAGRSLPRLIKVLSLSAYPSIAYGLTDGGQSNRIPLQFRYPSGQTSSRLQHLRDALRTSQAEARGSTMVFRRHVTRLVCGSLLTIMWAALPASFAQNCQNCSPSRLALGTLPISSNSGFANLNAVLAPAEAADAWTIRKRVDEVTVFFTATKGHKYVDDLTQQEVSVKDDHKPVARISAFGHQSDLPLRLGLLVDTSNSVHYRFSFEQEASTRFLQRIVRQETDLAFVMGFSDHITITQDYTGDTAKLAHGVSELHSDGATALFDAVRVACRKLANSNEHQTAARILVVLSDGEDNSSKSSLEGAITDAQRQEVTIYTISTNNSSYLRPGDKILKNLALQSGGQMFSPSSPKDMVRAFSAIEQEMRSRYALAYQPGDLVADGRFRRIEIIAQRLRQKFHVHARKGYYAPLAGASE
jgi:Ca-activated chloride channel homolog